MSMDERGYIRELYREYWRCMIAKDAEGLRELMADDSAVLTGKSRVLAAVYGGGKHWWKLRGDFTLRKENNHWKLTGSKASTY